MLLKSADLVSAVGLADHFAPKELIVLFLDGFCRSKYVIDCKCREKDTEES